MFNKLKAPPKTALFDLESHGSIIEYNLSIHNDLPLFNQVEAFINCISDYDDVSVMELVRLKDLMIVKTNRMEIYRFWKSALLN